MKTLTLILSLLLAAPSYAARFYPSPEVPNLTCADGIDNDADGTVDAADSDCAEAATLVTDGGNGYRGNFKDAIAPNFTTAADATAGSGTYLKKTSDVLGFYVGEGALHASFTNATYYAWIRYRCSETKCAAWFSSSPIKGNILNASQGMILANTASFTWIQVQYAGTNLNFYSGLNGGGNRTFALNGNGGIFFKATDGLELDCLVLDPDAGATPDCPDTGGSQPAFDYEILDVASAPTGSSDFDNANEITWTGFSDASGYTITRARIVWDKDASPQKIYAFVNITDTDAQNGTAAASDDASWFGSSAVRGDSIDFRWRSPADSVQAFDTDTYNASCNVNDLYADRDWTGGTSTLATNLNSASAGTVVASTSWSILCSFDAGGTIVADTIGLGQFFITDRDAAAATSKFMFGTTSGAATDASQWGRFKFSSTAVPGSPDMTAPTVNNTAETNLTTSSATITFSTNEAGTAFVVYGTSTGNYTLTSSTAACSSSCVITLTGLTSGTTYYYRAKVTDAAGNTGQSAEDTAATTSAATADLFASASGSGTTCSSGSPCTPAILLSQIIAGQIGEFAAGTYQETAEMIDPPDNKNGTAANPITVRCATDGACLIDGQGSRIPINLVNNDYWIIDGFNAKDSSDTVVQLGTGADNNIIRRVCAWDSPLAVNATIMSSNGNTGNLFEDVCAFGRGRKVFSNSQGGNNVTFRRAFGVWQDTTRTDTKQVFAIAYNSYNGLCENCIATWKEEGTPTGEKRGLFAADHMTGVTNKCANAKYLGSIGYMLSGQTGSYDGGMRWPSGIDCMTYDNVAIYHEKSIRSALLNNCGTACGATTPTYLITNTTEVGGSEPDTIGSQWTQSNRSNVASIAAMNSAGSNPFQAAAGTGARVCFRYENGTLTSTKLWPWPMDSRIGAAWDLRNGAGSALATFGSLTAPITTQMETIFGTIPAECKS